MEFPNLTNKNHRITSPATKKYNCIAWAAGDTKKNWWPDFMGVGKWPPGVPRSETIDAFIKAFETLGYEPCADGSLEEGFEKVAIYGKLQAGGSHAPTHMARQMSNGHWSSKLGAFEDIEHSDLEGLFGTTYGSAIVHYLRRPKI